MSVEEVSPRGQKGDASSSAMMLDAYPGKNDDGSMSERIALPAQEIHVWKVPVDLPPHQITVLEAVLHDAERQRAGRIKVESARRTWTATRAALRLILSRYVRVSPAHLVLHADPLGKPFLLQPITEPSITFNVAHSGSLALCAIGVSRRIGVDVEHVRMDVDHMALARRVCSDQERHRMESMPEQERLVAFFTYWVCKEAYVKAVGQGLRFPLAAVSVSFPATDSPVFTRIDGSSEEAQRWLLRSWSPASNYSAALVAEGCDWRYRRRDWSWDEYFSAKTC